MGSIKVAKEDEPQPTTDKIQTCRWGIGRTAPFLIIGPYCLALAIAICHAVVFRYLNGKFEKDPSIPSQSHVSAASTVAATVVDVCLRMSLAAVFTQYFWYLVRQTPLHLDTLDALYSLRVNLWGLLSARVLRRGWLLALIAIVLWCIPIAMSFPPSAMTITEGQSILTAMQDGIPSLNLSDTSGSNITTFQLHEMMDFNAVNGRILASFSNNFQQGNPVPKTLSNLATRAMINGEAYTMDSPCGLNCSYTIQFDGPYLDCNKSNVRMHTPVPRGGLTTVFDANWLHFDNRSVPEGPFQLQSLGDCSMDVFDNYTYDTVTCTQDTMSCYPRRAEYHVVQSFENGQQQSTVQFRKIQDLVSMTDGAAISNSDSWTWNLDANATAAAYIRDANILGLIMSMTYSLSGSYSATLNPNEYNVTQVSNATANWTRYQSEFGWAGARNDTLADLSQLFHAYDMAELSPDLADAVSYEGFDIATPSLFNLEPSIMQSMLTNVTLSTISQYKLWPTTANVTRSQSRSQYVFSSPLNLLLPYFLSLGVSLPLAILGYWALCKNGVPATDNGFLQVVMTTRGNKELDRLAAGGCLGGKRNVPPALKELEVVFGELAGGQKRLDSDGWAAVGIDDRPVTNEHTPLQIESEEQDGIALAGFASKDEVAPLQKRRPYGVQYS